MTVSIGTMNGASVFKTLGVILSGPAALVWFSLLRSFSTPDTVMRMSFISGVVPCILQRLDNLDGIMSSETESDLETGKRVAL
jgi:hypothetical protein